MAIARAIGFKIRTAVTLGLVLSLFATGLIVLRSAAAAGTPLLSIGNDVLSANQNTVTYRVEVRNAGNGQADNVRVKLGIPAGTSFESSNPPPYPADGAVTPDCDNGGTREPGATPPSTNCEWFFGSLEGGALVEMTYVLNILPLPAPSTSTTTITTAPSVTGKTPTGSDIPAQTDPDSSLKIEELDVSQDTWVDRNKPNNTNYGACPVLTARGNGTAAAYVDFAALTATTTERVWAAELQATVAASDHSSAAPGTLSVHAIESGDWTEGPGSQCPAGQLATGHVSTGSEPAVEQTPTSTTQVTGTGAVSWNVTGDLDGAAERAAFQGWQIRNTTGNGSMDIHSKQGPDPAKVPRIVMVYTTPETTQKCIDVKPESSTGFPTSEQTLTAVFYDGTLVKRESVDACNGTPVGGQQVGWDIDKEFNEPTANTTSPDIYISRQDGTVVPRTTDTTEAGPDTITTITDASGVTSIGIRLANPQSWGVTENRVAGCIGTCGDVGTANMEPETCTATDSLAGACAKKGESVDEDDAILRWSETATPDPEDTSPPPQGPPSVTSFSPTSGPVGTQVIVNGTNFTGTTAVRFNGKSAGFSVNSPNQITTSVPTGATDGPISVQNTAGTRLSATNFDVIPSTTSPSPTPTSTSTSIASPSASVSPTGLSTANLTLTSSSEKTMAFSEVTLSGALGSDNPLCAQPGTTIEILKREAESTSYGHLAFLSTGVGGLFEHKVKPEANTFYVAAVPEHGSCAAGGSSEIVVLVKPKITIKSTSKTVEKGRKFWITGSVLPEHQLTAVKIFRKTGPGQWEFLGKDFLDAGSRYALALKYTWKSKAAIFIARWKATDADHISGKSPQWRIERLVVE